jgi:hypothetical protein
MSQVFNHLFLLFLFACDWAGDPYHGRSPLSRPFCNQEVSCHTVLYRQPVCKEILVIRWVKPCFATPSDFAQMPSLERLFRYQPAVLSPADGFTYVFMSIQR